MLYISTYILKTIEFHSLGEFYGTWITLIKLLKKKKERKTQKGLEKAVLEVPVKALPKLGSSSTHPRSHDQISC